MEPAELIEEALRASAGDFIRLADEVASTLAGGYIRSSGAEVVGRLVRLPRTGRAIIVSDIHGDIVSLQYVLRGSRFLERASSGEELWLVFLGDYGDRGERSPEVYYVVLRLEELFPERVVLLRGNHEGPRDLLASPHDMPFHFIAKFGADDGLRAYGAIRSLWDELYTAALVEGSTIMLHGGAPSTIKSVQDLALAQEKHPEEPHLEEVLWSDPEDGVVGTLPSWRGAGRIFGPDVTRRFLLTVNVKALVRGHEPCELGYKLNHGGLVLTLFSRKGPPYFNERAAYMELDLSVEPSSAEGLKPYVRTF